MCLAQPVKIELVAAPPSCTLHRDEVGERADGRLHPIDSLHIRPVEHIIEWPRQKLFGQDVHQAMRRAESQRAPGRQP